MSTFVNCPGCGRRISTDSSRYGHHSTIPRGDAVCFMSEQRLPVTGREPCDFRARATLVADLALQVRDEDPHLVWGYLTAMPADVVQELLQIALAAIPVEGKTVDEIWAWVTELPDALAAAG